MIPSSNEIESLRGGSRSLFGWHPFPLRTFPPMKLKEISSKKATTVDNALAKEQSKIERNCRVNETVLEMKYRGR